MALSSSLSRCGPCRPQTLPFSFLLPAAFPLQFFRNASHATEGRANRAKQGPGKRLGAKRAATELVVPGNIIFKQRGTHWFPGENCGMGRDHTIFAKEKGYVVYYRDKWRNSAGERKFIGVVFERGQTLPRHPGAPRVRRLGLMAKERDMSKAPESSSTAGLQTTGYSQKGVSMKAINRQKLKKAQRKLRQDAMLKLKPGYQYRESNWSIGRTAERRGVKVKVYNKNDRMAIWRRKLAARKEQLLNKAMATTMTMAASKSGKKNEKGGKKGKGRARSRK